MATRYFGGLITAKVDLLLPIGPLGTASDPFTSPTQAAASGAVSGRSYFFKSGSMSTAIELLFQDLYYDSKPFCLVFRSAYSDKATVNKLGLNIPMGGLLVQRDSQDLRAAVYWNTATTYNAVGGAGITADSGYAYRRVILGYNGGHGIYNTSQQQCAWGDSIGAVGAGWDGGTCGTFPNNLIWGTGVSGTAVYTNRSGIWSHWVTW